MRGEESSKERKVKEVSKSDIGRMELETPESLRRS